MLTAYNSYYLTALCTQPYEFVVGEPVLGQTLKKSDADGGNGLFAGAPGPKPPQALSRAVIGMKKGGKVRERSLFDALRACAP